MGTLTDPSEAERAVEKAGSDSARLDCCAKALAPEEDYPDDYCDVYHAGEGPYCVGVCAARAAIDAEKAR